MAEVPGELLPWRDALEAVLSACRPLPEETAPLAGALGRALARPAVARGAVPSFDNSSMDGYAARAGDLAGGPVTLPLAPAGAAGRAPAPLPAGHAAYVATGAPMPEGADAVVPIEDATREDDRVMLPGGVPAGEFVRRVGSDIPAGAEALPAGTPLGPAEGALLAAIGVVDVPVRRRPRVAILSTGAELVPPDQEPGPAGIRDANATGLAWACRAAGAEVELLGIAEDEPGPTRDLLARGLETADVLISSGGVSVGERDHVRDALAALGVERIFWGVALRPGKPCTLGRRGDALVFGLPGNPASALVGTELFVRPALRALAGWAEPRPRTQPAVAGGGWPGAAARAHAVRCRLGVVGASLVATPTGDQGSHRLASIAAADALALLEPGRRPEPGETVEVLQLA